MAETIFYVVGGVLAAWAVLVSFLGITRSGFPDSRGAERTVASVSVVLVVATIGSGIVAGIAEEEVLEQEDEQAETAPTETETAPTGTETAPTDTETAPEVAGRDVFADAGCASCHTLAAADANGTTGPNLDETLPGQSPEQIRTAIVDPNAEVAEGFSAGVMPDDFQDQLSDAELDALVDFLAANAGGG